MKNTKIVMLPVFNKDTSEYTYCSITVDDVFVNSIKEVLGWPGTYRGGSFQIHTRKDNGRPQLVYLDKRNQVCSFFPLLGIKPNSKRKKGTAWNDFSIECFNSKRYIKPLSINEFIKWRDDYNARAVTYNKPVQQVKEQVMDDDTREYVDDIISTFSTTAELFKPPGFPTEHLYNSLPDGNLVTPLTESLLHVYALQPNGQMATTLSTPTLLEQLILDGLTRDEAIQLIASKRFQ